jgi:ABC-type sugar transport system ATPase subunit
LYRGTPVFFHNPTNARAHGIATIYQEFSLVPSLSIAENIFLGNYKTRKSTGMIEWRVILDGTRKILEQLSLDIDPEMIVKRLSVAEQQIVEIAKAISMESSLLIMDEPTAALGMTETKHLMELIRRLTDQNKAIIYISHRLDEVFEIADKVTVLKDGHRVGTNQISELKMGDVVRMMIGFDIEKHYPKEVHVKDIPLLEIEHLSTENRVNDVSFTIKTGEVFGLGGMLGSGRTEIGRAIYGLDRITGGSIRLNRREVHFNSPAQAINWEIGLIPENRKVDGSFFNFEGPKNITISRLKNLLQGPFLSLSRERNIGMKYIKKMNIPETVIERSVRFLSGGNQQKVIIARWLFSEARLLIMDEPTQGIDIGAKLEVYNVINELTANGISILLISSDFPELLAMSDRVGVVRDGRILFISEKDSLSEYELISAASGVGLESEKTL